MMLKEKSRLEYLDALRGIAAFSVLIQHILGHIYNTNDSTHPLYPFIKTTIFESLDFGRFGVVLFFLISGFIIPNSLKPNASLQRFLITRTFRLYPAYWVTCFLILISAPYLSQSVYGMAQLLANLTMVPKFFHAKEMSGIFWTLFVEILFYFCCAALFQIKSLEKPVVIGLIALILNITTPLAISLNKFFHLGAPVQFVLFHLSFLFMGSIFRLAIDKKDKVAKKISFLLLALVLMTVPLTPGMMFPVPEATATQFVMHRSDAVVYSYFLAISVFIYVVYSKSRISHFWVNLGEVSYSLYLLHMLCFVFVAQVIPPTSLMSSVAFILLSILLSYIVAKLSFSFIERPAIEAGKKMIYVHGLA